MRFAVASLSRLMVLDEPPPMTERVLRDASGGETTLAALTDGEVSVVNIWATWCAPCKDEMPTLGVLQQRFAGRARVIAVSADADSKIEQAKSELATLAHNRLDFYVDNSRGVLFDLRAPGLPLTIIYDRHGREVARVGGAADWSSEEAAALVEAVIAGDGA